MRISTVAIAALCLASVAGWVLAVEGAPAHTDGARDGHDAHFRAGDRFFDRYDLNHDGKITKDEMEQVRAKHFADADLNHDGVIDKDEFYQYGLAEYRRRSEMMFKMMDQNSDGKIAPDEMPRRMLPFAVLDKNGDGAITHDELARVAMWHHMHHGMGRGDRGMHDGTGHGGHGPHRNRPPVEPPTNQSGGD